MAGQGMGLGGEGMGLGGEGMGLGYPPLCISHALPFDLRELQYLGEV